MRPHHAMLLGAGLLVSTVIVLAGPLDPPAGPVASTYKTLNEVEPRRPVQSLAGSATAKYTITSPGSYYLTGPVTGIAGKSGIEIAASDVVLDLCGFSITGVTGAIDGIVVDAGVNAVTIERGVIQGWSGTGLNAASARGTNVRGIIARQCATGIVAGGAAIVSDCTAANNTASGISGGVASRVTACTADHNGAVGFYLSDGARAEACTAVSNGAHGYYLDGDGCFITGCTARANGVGGITAIYICTIESSVVEFNAGIGLLIPTGSTARDCTAHSNDQGGISAGDGSVVESCTARLNTAYGIRVTDRCRVEGNTCSESRGFGVSAGAGIQVVGAGSRIDGNTLTSNDVGLLVTGSGNVVVRNAAAGNVVGFNLAPGQSAGPVVTGAGVLTTASPWANFEN